MCGLLSIITRIHVMINSFIIALSTIVTSSIPFFFFCIRSRRYAFSIGSNSNTIQSNSSRSNVTSFDFWRQLRYLGSGRSSLMANAVSIRPKSSVDDELYVMKTDIAFTGRKAAEVPFVQE